MNILWFALLVGQRQSEYVTLGYGEMCNVVHKTRDRFIKKITGRFISLAAPRNTDFFRVWGGGLLFNSVKTVT